MQFIRCEVATTCVGIAMSMGALLLGGRPGGKAVGAAELQESSSTRSPAASRARAPTSRSRRGRRSTSSARLEEIIGKHTNQPVDKVSKDMERDYYMTADEARDYGIVDNVVAHR